MDGSEHHSRAPRTAHTPDQMRLQTPTVQFIALQSPRITNVSTEPMKLIVDDTLPNTLTYSLSRAQGDFTQL